MQQEKIEKIGLNVAEIEPSSASRKSEFRMAVPGVMPLAAALAAQRAAHRGPEARDPPPPVPPPPPPALPGIEPKNPRFVNQ